MNSLFVGLKIYSVEGREFLPEQLFWASPTSRSVDVQVGEVKGSIKHGRQILHHRSHKCFMVLSDVL